MRSCLTVMLFCTEVLVAPRGCAILNIQFRQAVLSFIRTTLWCATFTSSPHLQSAGIFQLVAARRPLSTLRPRTLHQHPTLVAILVVHVYPYHPSSISHRSPRLSHDHRCPLIDVPTPSSQGSSSRVKPGTADDSGNVK